MTTDPFEEIRNAFHIREEIPARRLSKPRSGKALVGAPSTQEYTGGLIQGPRELEPWETPTFKPGDEDLVRRVQSGRRLTGLLLGASVWDLEGVRWIVLQNPISWWSLSIWLAYPLPGSFGTDPYKAAQAFRQVWWSERRCPHS